MPRKNLLVLLIVYILSSVASFAAFSFTGKGSENLAQADVAVEETDEGTLLGQLLEIDPSEPKDAVCPLSGAYYTKTEKDAWEKRRPLAIMIENSPDARPQSGLIKSDIVYEAVAEGSVTRFMALMYCNVQRQDTVVAPIRSARTYFVDWASGYNRPLYVHVGGANLAGPADALGQISKYGWALETDLNQFSIGYPTFVRNANRLNGKEIATEHTMESSTERLWKIGEKRGWTNMSPELKQGRTVIPAKDWKDGFKGWSYQDEVPEAGEVRKISYGFGSQKSAYSVSWEYNPEHNTYKRSQGGEAHVDLETGKQIEASNVIVLQTRLKGPIDELHHMLYTTLGRGNALIFKNGQMTKATWSKPKRESELVFTDSRGLPIKLARGMTWISVLDNSTEVNY